MGILRRIFGSKREWNGEWRRLHNEKIPTLYRTPNIVRVMKSRWLRRAGHVTTGTPAGKRPLGRPRCRWEDNIRMDIKDISINTRNWFDSAQGRNYWRALVNAAVDSLHYARTFHLLEILAEAFRCHVHNFQCLMIKFITASFTRTFKHWKWCTWHRKASAKISSKWKVCA